MKKLTMIGIAVLFTYWCVLSLCFITSAHAEKIPALVDIPSNLPSEIYAKFSQQKQVLEKELSEIQSSAAIFNKKDAKEQSDAEYDKLDAWRTAYISKVKKFNEAVTAQVVEEQQRTEKVQKGWKKALGCAMEEVYSRSESLGQDGIRFAQDLRNEMTRVFNEAGHPVKDKDDVNVVSLNLNREISAGKNSNDQFIVEIIVNTHGDGNIHVIVDSYFSKTAGKKNKHDEVESILILDKYGRVTESQNSKKVKSCLTH